MKRTGMTDIKDILRHRHFEDVTDHPITRAMGSDGDDSTIGRR
ncbi:MAG: hypothetical protein OXE57_16015 [Alphaproteobacteria bacterium]|nr:hypothetical protein [Alphaproteobacteria bacterium]